MRSEDLVAFIKHHCLEAYLQGATRNGKEPTLDRDWLLVVSETGASTHSYIIECMSLKTTEFTSFRKKALISRKERVMKSSHSEVITIKEIADALKSTSMVNGRSRLPFVICI